MTSDKLEVSGKPPNRTLKVDRVIYWIFTALTLLFLLVFGVHDLLHTQTVSATIQHLGYPWYFSYLLGTGKLLAATALAYPRTRVLREWAYAGITFELISSFASHWFVGDTWQLRVAPLIMLTIVAVACRYDPHRVATNTRSAAQ